MPHASPRWKARATALLLTTGIASGLLATTTDPVAAAIPSQGPLDVTFGTDGRVVTAVSTKLHHLDSLTSLLLQPDGKIVASGWTDGTVSNDFALVRFNADGSLDPTFDGDGKVATDVGSFDGASTVVRQSDAKLVAVGRRNALSNGDVALVRYDANGTVDSGYGTAGITITDVGTSSHDTASGAVVQSDDKVVVVGITAPTLSSSSNEIFALRYDTAGVLDPSFGTGGRVTTTVGSGMHYFGAPALQADGKVVVVGSSGGLGAGRIVTVVRYNTDGTPDATFDGDGIVTTAFGTEPSFASTVAVQPDAKIVVGAYVGGGFTDFALARYNPDGSLDSTFSGDGLVVTPGPGQGVRALAIDPEGRIVTTGAAQSSRSSSNDFMVVRYTPDGRVDAGFGVSGVATAAIVDRQSFDTPSAIVLQADGRIVVGGSTSEGSADSQFALVRFDPGYRGLTSLAPARVLDSRSGGGGRLPAGTVTRVQSGAPAGTPSVLVNLTMTDAELPGYITADKCSVLVAGPQTKSNGNFAIGQNIANSAVVNLDADGAFCVFNEQSVHLLVDVQGYYGNSGNRLVTTTPTRALDTRQNSAGRRGAGSITRVNTGVAPGTVAVLVNLTMTDAELPGYITADKCSVLVAGPQTKSNGNFAIGQNIANSSVVNVDVDGAFCIFNEQPVHLLADVQGTYRPNVGLDITTVTPSRVLDTRVGTVPAAGTITRVNTGVAAGTVAVLVNLTMTDAGLPGYITADKCSVLAAGPQTKSNGNAAPGSTIANSAVVSLDADGAFCIYNEQPVHLLADIQATYR